MTLKKTISINTYSCKLTVTITDEIGKDIKKLEKKFKPQEPYEIRVEGIFITQSGAQYHLLIDQKFLSHNTIAHEIYHATVAITEDRCIEDEESQAWLCGYLTGEFYKFCESKKLVITHGS